MTLPAVPAPVQAGESTPGPSPEARLVPGGAPGEAGAVHVGDRVAVTLSAPLPGGCAPGIPREVEPGTDWALLPREAGPAGAAVGAADGDAQVSLWLVPFRTGDLVFPGAVLPWTCADGRGGEARSASLSLRVEPLLENAAQAAPADIRGPARMRAEGSSLLLWGAFAALLAGAAALWWRRRRRASAPAGASVRPDGLSPDARALLALDALLADRLLEREGIEAFHQALSDIVRRYVRERYAVDAPERTTREILDEIEARTPALPGSRHRLGTVLDGCDMVKFALARPSAEDARHLATAARRFVEETRPASAPAGVAA